MKPRSQRGASMVELIIALPMFLMLIFGIAELSLIYQAKSILDMATLAAARAGAIKNGSTSVMRTAAAAAMAPLYAPGTSNIATAIGRSLNDNTNPLTGRHWIGSTNIIHTPAGNFNDAGGGIQQGIRVEVLSPTRQMMNDFGVMRENIGGTNTKDKVIPNDNLMYRDTRLINSVNVQDANLLKIRVTYLYETKMPMTRYLFTPFMNANLTAVFFGGEAARSASDPTGGAARIPLVSYATVRMQSDFTLAALNGADIPSGLTAPSPSPPVTTTPITPPEEEIPVDIEDDGDGDGGDGGGDGGGNGDDGDENTNSSDTPEDHNDDDDDNDNENPACEYDCTGNCIYPNGDSNDGMMGAAVHSLLASLALTDTPLIYRPAKGPKVPLTFTYSQREAYQPDVFHYTNLGPKWTYTGISYIVDDPVRPGRKVQRYLPGGGTHKFKKKDYDPATGVFAPDRNDMSVLARMPGETIRYERRLNDGSLDIYAHSDGKKKFPRKIFLTEQRDPAGNALKYQYDGKNRLVALIDASGKKTLLEYKHADPLKLTALIDPAGRRAKIAYDEQGRLVSITDAVSIVSKVSYRGVSTFVEQLETPYGVTRFNTGEDTHSRWVEITNALGHTARVESRRETPGIPSSEQEIPIGIDLLNRDLHRHNTFYWDAANYAKHKGDYMKAHIQHWLTQNGRAINLMSSIKPPLESRVWYRYQGQKNASSPGSCPRPSVTARVLPDGSTQIERMDYNPQGQLTRHLDPMGRETLYEYAKNGIDLVKVRQKNGERYDTLKQITWNEQHRPLSIQDAAGQTTRYAYNDSGQIIRQSNTLEGKKEYRYDEQGRLIQILNTRGRTQVGYTYDAAGNIASETDSEGYILKHQYDNLSRITQTTWPDGTTRETTWDKLDVARVKERSGKLTHYQYDAARNLIAETDALRTTRYGYDASNRRTSLTDGNGQVTHWERDLQGRIITKTSADGTKSSTEYDRAGRQIKKTDALGQQRLFSYTKDNKITRITYQNTRLPTPEVRLTWDESYPRLASLTDGTGTTRYRYGHTGAPGALKQTEETGPGASNVHRMSWDKVGRLKSQSLGTATERYAYDALGRLTQNRNNLLGRFSYDYLGETRQIVRAALSGTPIEHTYDYETNTADRRLKEIRHPSAARSYSYQSRPEHIITKLTETAQGHSHTWQYEYDALDRLQSATRSDGQAYRYLLDKGDNLTQIATPAGTRDYEHDAGNKIVGYKFDANGNRIEDERHTYQWDAENRLVKIGYKNHPQRSTEFKYDGLSRRVAIIETDGTARSETKYSWCGQVICQARNELDQPIAYYFKEGTYRVQAKGGKKEFYAKDHLGSIRDVLDATGKPIARYDYDPYGNLINAKDQKPDFGYAEMHYHGPSGLYLTQYRAYDPQSGRWLSRDPLEEEGGINLYAYVEGNPISFVDPTGEVAIVFAIPAIMLGTVTVAMIAQYFGISQSQVKMNGNEIKILESPKRNGGNLIVSPWKGPEGLCPTSLDGKLTQQGEQDLGAMASGSVDEWGRQIDPTAKPLTDAHQATGKDRTKPGYGGNCTPDEYDGYDAQKTKWCDDTASVLGGCSSNMSYFDLMQRGQAWSRCANARDNLMNNCFAGGDSGHRTAAGNAWTASNKCYDLIH